MKPTHTPPMYKQLALIEFRNNAPFVEKFTSAKPITLDRIAEHLEQNDGFDEERDSITLINSISDTNIDEETPAQISPTESAVQTWNSLLDNHHEPCALFYPVSGHLEIFTDPDALQNEITSWRGEPVTYCHITTFLQLYDLNITGFSANE